MNFVEVVMLTILNKRRRLLWDTKDMLESLGELNAEQRTTLNMVSARLKDVNQKIQELEKV